MNYVDLASSYYAKYRALQVRIEKIEANAMARYGGNSSLAGHMLRTGSDYWLYRELVADRNLALAHAQINSSMAAIRDLL